MTLPNVRITFPARDRAWVLPHTLLAIENLRYPKDKISLEFIAHNCQDETYDTLTEWCDNNGTEYRYHTVDEVHDATPPDGRTSRERDRSPNDPRHAQGRLKNRCLAANEHWFFLDSDVLLHPDALRLMAEAQKDIVGGLANVTPDPPYIWNYFPANPGPGMPFRRNSDPLPTTLTRVGLVCGILLYSPRAARDCSFSFVGVGEDEGAMRDAERLGYEVWLEPRAYGRHVMRREDLPKAVEEWETWL